jgi:hypothetical protein
MPANEGCFPPSHGVGTGSNPVRALNTCKTAGVLSFLAGIVLLGIPAQDGRSGLWRAIRTAFVLSGTTRSASSFVQDLTLPSCRGRVRKRFLGRPGRGGECGEVRLDRVERLLEGGALRPAEPGEHVLLELDHCRE